MTRIVRACSGTPAVIALFVFISADPSCAGKPQSSTVLSNIDHAEALIQQGHFDEAKTAIVEELKRNPASVEGYNLLGIVESNQQDYSNALAAFQKALDIAPNFAKTHNNLAAFYISQKKPNLAEKEYRTVVRLEPANADGNYNLGLLLMSRGKSAEAIPHFERVRAANLATSFNLIRAYFQCKRTEEALRLAKTLSDANEGNVQVDFTLGILLASEKQYKPALFDLEKADALQPGTFEILYNLGKVYLRSGDDSKAELAFNRALELKPESAETLYSLAQSYADQSRPRDALDLLVRAHKIAPGDTDIIYLLAQVSMSQNYYEDAIPLLESGLQISPERPNLIAALGESYFMSDKADHALEEFKKLIQIDPSARSYALLGISNRNLGRFDEAIQYFQKGLDVDSHNASCLLNLGLIKETRGDSAGAEAMISEVVRLNPDFPLALLELAKLRMADKRPLDAEALLRRYVKVSPTPAAGYYQLAMVERSLHQTAAADRDLEVFQSLSRDVSSGSYPYQHLFDYLDNRAQLAPGARDQLEMAELIDRTKNHPDQPDDLYRLADAYLKSGKLDEARSTIAQLDKISSGDYRTLTGIGVLLAHHHLYDEAIQHFRAALHANPGSDEETFDLANAYFRNGTYSEALDIAGKVSESGRSDEAYLALVGDIYEHLGDYQHAEEIFRNAIARNPDNDQGYLSQALLQLRENNIESAKQTLVKGEARIPASGKVLWGLGVVAIAEGHTAEAAEHLERAVDLVPEWTGSYSLLGIFYFQTGQITKAKEVFGRFKLSSSTGGLDLKRIEQVLSQRPPPAAGDESLTMATRKQLVQMALSLADRTL